ncbi:MAG: extracellular solute-binding protein [Alphaproteobacteria bacterium]
MRVVRHLTLLLALSSLAAVPTAAGHAAEPRHGASMYGELKYGPDFEHFDYADPDARKGGHLKLAAVGSFDSLNPFILKGTPAANLGLIFDTLTVQSEDEPFSEYGLLAETIEIPEDRSWVAFELREEARWHDGEPVTAEDVVFSFNVLRDAGRPFYRSYYANVAEVTIEGERRVKFTFDDTMNRELPLIIGQLPILPEHYYADRPFDATTLEPPLGSGPYRIAEVDSGRQVVFERVEDYWAKDLPVNTGRYNYDRITLEYFRDSNVALQAFLAGTYDLRFENTARLWATAYEGPPVAAGDIVLEEIERQGGTGMQGFVYNTRREIFKDPRVREALAYAFDFEWTNEKLFYGQYTRTESYFSNSELAAEGRPSKAELELLEPWRDELPERVFTEAYAPPETDGSGNIRPQLERAFALLTEAGWEVEGRTLTHTETGRELRFEILLVSPAFERIVNPFVRNLERLGIEVRVRTVDPAQYENRLTDFDFDMIVNVWGQSLSPGNEQRDYWSCAAAETAGSRNYAGICEEPIDALIDEVIQAPSREDLITATRALDRALLSGHYVIPHWHTTAERVARWDVFGRPEVMPKYGVDLWSWWIAPDKVDALAGSRDRD